MGFDKLLLFLLFFHCHLPTWERFLYLTFSVRVGTFDHSHPTGTNMLVKYRKPYCNLADIKFNGARIIKLFPWSSFRLTTGRCFIQSKSVAALICQPLAFSHANFSVSSFYSCINRILWLCLGVKEGTTTVLSFLSLILLMILAVICLK